MANAAGVTIVNGQPAGILPAGTTAATMTFRTTTSASICRYSTAPNMPFSSMTTAFAQRGSLLFYQSLTGLSNGATYNYYIRCWDSVTSTTNDQDYVISFSVASTPGPQVSSVSGQFVQNSQLTITGTNFGVKAPAAPVLWENFENGTADTYLKDRPGSVWPPNATPGAKYSATQSYSGTLSAYNRITPTSGTAFATNHFAFTPTDKMYGSYRFRIDSPSIDKYGVLKLSRFASNYDGPVTHTDWYNGPGNTSWFRSAPDLTNGGTAASYDSGNTVTQRYVLTVAPGAWQRYDMYKELSSPGVADGQVLFSRNGMTGWRDFNVVTRDAGFTFQLSYFTLGLMIANARNDGDFSLFIDDVYLDNTLARVEVCDEPTWAEIERDGANCELQIPSAWSANSITVNVNRGRFSGGAAYLYVIDSQGNVSPGKQIELSATRKPMSPANFQVK